MNYLEEMFDFVEGSLEGEKELELFSALSANSELRNKMKNLYSIKNAAKENAAGYQPTAAETMAVFSALSIAPPADLVPVQPSIIDKFGTVLNKYSQGIIGAFIAAALIFGYLAINSDKDRIPTGSGVPFISSTEGAAGFEINLKSNNENIAVSVSKDNNSEISAPDNSIPNSNSGFSFGNNHYRQSYGGTTNAGNNSAAIITNPVINEETTDLSQSSSEDVALQDIEFALGSKDLTLGEGINLRFANQGISINTIDLASIPFSGNNSLIKGITLEIRGISNLDNNSPFNPNNSFDLNNVAFSAMYDLGKGFFAGADIRQESFYINTTFGTSFDNQYGVLSKNLSFGILLRYQSDIISGTDLFPMIQLSAGKSSYGYNGRLMLGAKYLLTKNIAIIGGFESTGFSHSDYGFVNKNSITYGIEYGL